MNRVGMGNGFAQVAYLLEKVLDIDPTNDTVRETLASIKTPDN